MKPHPCLWIATIILDSSSSSMFNIIKKKELFPTCRSLIGKRVWWMILRNRSKSPELLLGKYGACSRITHFNLGSLLITRGVLWQFILSCSKTSHLTSYCLICQYFIATCFQESNTTFPLCSATGHIDSKPSSFSTAHMLGLTVWWQRCHEFLSNTHRFFLKAYFLMTLICDWVE